MMLKVPMLTDKMTLSWVTTQFSSLRCTAMESLVVWVTPCFSTQDTLKVLPQE